MGEVISLRRARKAKVRTAAEAQAAVNRAAFGRTRSEKQAELAETERRARDLDGARRDR